MSLNADRVIFLDDTDPSIRYDGPWSLVNSDSGIFGTLHGLSEPTGVVSLSVDFTGTLISAWVITLHGNDGTGSVSNPVLYSANCLINGSSVSITSESEFALAQTPLCDSMKSLPPGTHTLEIILTFPSPNPDFGFYLDYVIVMPAANQAIGAQENLFIFWDDPTIQTSIQQANTGWTNQEGWVESSTEGSQFTFQFTGVSIIWFGERPTSPSLANTTATYTIDGGNSFSVDLFDSAQLPSHPGLFSTLEYPYGNHTLHIVYHGNSKSVPLSLSSLIVQGGNPNVPQTSTTTSTSSIIPSTLSTPIPVTSSASAPVSNSDSASASASAQSDHHEVGAARVGGIVGGVLVFLIIVAVVVYFLVWRRTRSQKGHGTVWDNPLTVDHPNSNEQTSETGLTHATPFAYGHDSHRTEMHWTPQVTPSPQFSSNPTSQAENSSTSEMAWNDDRKGGNRQLRIVQ